MADITVSVDIQRPVEDVFAFVVDVTNDTAWIDGIREARLLGGGPIATGSHVERIAGFLGRKIEYEIEVTDFEPNVRLHMKTVKATFPMVLWYDFEPTETGTRFTQRVQGSPGGFFRLARPLLEVALRKNVTRDMNKLRGILEG